MALDLVWGLSVGLIVAVIATIFSLLYKIYLERYVASRELSGKELMAEITQTIRRLEPEPTSPMRKKIEDFKRMGPKTFYYLDENQVRDLHSQIFQEPAPRKVRTRETRETKKGIAAKLKVIEPKYEKGKTEETTKLYDTELTPSIMFNRVEQHLLDAGEITFGLEVFEYDESWVDEFESLCEELQDEYSLSIPKDTRDSVVEGKMSEFADHDLGRIANSSGYVAIQHEFEVGEVNESSCTLVGVHPITFHMKGIVQIRITCPTKYITPSGLSTFKKGKFVRITCVGKVVVWDRMATTLEVSPIAIY